MRQARRRAGVLAKALKDLRIQRIELAAWEFWLLLVLVVTVFGIAFRGPLGLPSLLSSIEPYHVQQVEQDPYDVHQDSSISDVHNNVETGL